MNHLQLAERSSAVRIRRDCHLRHYSAVYSSCFIICCS